MPKPAPSATASARQFVWTFLGGFWWWVTAVLLAAIEIYERSTKSIGRRWPVVVEALPYILWGGVAACVVLATFRAYHQLNVDYAKLRGERTHREQSLYAAYSELAKMAKEDPRTIQGGPDGWRAEFQRRLGLLKEAFGMYGEGEQAAFEARVVLVARARRAADPLAKPGEADYRRFAILETHKHHKDLVERLFDLKVLDPAMGSGHFLVEAVDFITDELLHFMNAFPVNPVMAALEQTREAILESLREQGLQTDEALERQLTDVHLLKRHVLKRCIYGVDLNPLATELTKVSLWLDAFTIGAPLSFLDHHLRTGNSLIGCSVPELDRLVEGHLHGFNTEPITIAVNRVLTIARSADATAAEAKRSADHFLAARRDLSGYALALDLLASSSFGNDDAVSILRLGGGLDVSNAASFQASLGSPHRKIEGSSKARHTQLSRERAAIDTAKALAQNRKFFHWDLEFPEVFYTLAGVAEGRIERRPVGNAGFDAISGTCLRSSRCSWPRRWRSPSSRSGWPRTTFGSSTPRSAPSGWPT